LATKEIAINTHAMSFSPANSHHARKTRLIRAFSWRKNHLIWQVPTGQVVSIPHNDEKFSNARTSRWCD